MGVSISSVDLAQWFAARDDAEEPDRTQMKVLKLIYFAQAHYLAATGRRLVDERTFAWDHGPVYTSARQLMIDSAYSPFKPESVPEFDESVEEFLLAVDAKYGRLSAAALRNLSHEDEPYAAVYVPDVLSIVIPDESMAVFYRKPELAFRWIDCPDVVTVSAEAEAEMDDLDVESAVRELCSALSTGW